MIHYREYVKPSDLAEAYELNKKKTAVIAGGFCFLRLGNRTIQTLIDLSGLLSSGIEENASEFRIGAMATLRDLEKHIGLNWYTDEAVRDSVKHIVGTQFRNLATIGGSLYGRFGFSDLLTCFLSLDSYVELYKGGRVSLQEFAKMEKDSDILLSLIVKKTALYAAYESMRNEATDFPVLSVAAAEYETGITAVCIGARPAKAERVMFKGSAKELWEADSATMERLIGQFCFGTNMRASKEYREYLAGVLIRRAAKKIDQAKEGQACR